MNLRVGKWTKIFLVIILFAAAIVGFMIKLPPRFRQIDKESHAVFYFLAAALLNLLFAKKNILIHLLIFGLLYLFGMTIEYAQEYSNRYFQERIHGRYDPEDIKYNLKGLVAFSGLWLVYVGLLFVLKKPSTVAAEQQRKTSDLPETSGEGVKIHPNTVVAPQLQPNHGAAKQIAKHFRDVHFGGNWTAVNLKDTLAGINWEQATAKVHSFNTIAALVYHINYYVWNVLKVLQGEPLAASDKNSFDVPSITSQEEWETLLNKVWADAERFASLVEQLPDEQLNKMFADEKYGNWFRNLHGIIEHCHYHLGQIVLIKKIVSV